MRYSRTGAPIPSHIPSSTRVGSGTKTMVSLAKGNIVDIIYPEDPRNRNGEHIEYTVNIDGRDCPGVLDMKNRGAIYNSSDKIRKVPEKIFGGEAAGDSSVFDENSDAELVYVLFLGGDKDFAVIIGSASHPKQNKKHTKTDGVFDRDEFNGVEVLIDKDSNYIITQNGRKNPEGEILNPDAVGAFIKLYGNGDFEAQNSRGKIFKLTDMQILGQGDEPVVLGDTLESIVNTFLQSLILGIIPGSVGQNAASLLVIKSAAVTLASVLSTMKSDNSRTD